MHSLRGRPVGNVLLLHGILQLVSGKLVRGEQGGSVVLALLALGNHLLEEARLGAGLLEGAGAVACRLELALALGGEADHVLLVVQERSLRLDVGLVRGGLAGFAALRGADHVAMLVVLDLLLDAVCFSDVPLLPRVAGRLDLLAQILPAVRQLLSDAQQRAITPAEQGRESVQGMGGAGRAGTGDAYSDITGGGIHGLDAILGLLLQGLVVGGCSVAAVIRDSFPLDLPVRLPDLDDLDETPLPHRVLPRDLGLGGDDHLAALVHRPFQCDPGRGLRDGFRRLGVLGLGGRGGRRTTALATGVGRDGQRRGHRDSSDGRIRMPGEGEALRMEARETSAARRHREHVDRPKGRGRAEGSAPRRRRGGGDGKVTTRGGGTSSGAQHGVQIHGTGKLCFWTGNSRRQDPFRNSFQSTFECSRRISALKFILFWIFGAPRSFKMFA